jgi:hypothetical protein
MIRHQAISTALPLIPIIYPLEYFQKLLTIIICSIDILPRITASSCMIESTSKFNPEWPGHRIYSLKLEEQIKLKLDIVNCEACPCYRYSLFLFSYVTAPDKVNAH